MISARLSQTRRIAFAILFMFSIPLLAGAEHDENPQIALYGSESFRAPYAGMVGKPAPEFHVERWVSGEPVKMTDLKGQVVLLDFWGVWCGPCVAATDELIELHETYNNRGLTVVGVHTQRKKEGADAYVAKKKVPYHCFIDANDETLRAYHVRKAPTFTLIDHEGNLRYINIDWGRKEVRGNLQTAVRLLVEERESALATP